MTTTEYKPTAKDVQELRQRTGAGMMDCRNALTASNGDMNLAVENLRKAGIAKAEKRAGRVASEGRIVVNIAPDAKSGSMLELNSETDFVSRNDEFGAVADALGKALFATSFNDNVADATGAPFLSTAFEGKTVQDKVTETSAKTGENVVLRRYARLTTDGTLGTYIHHNGRVAVIVEVTPGGPAAQELAKTIQNLVDEASKAAGSPMTVKRFVRYRMGE